MIKLTEINKIYRTNEIENVALENVNLENFSVSWDLPVVENLHCSTL